MSCVIGIDGGTESLRAFVFGLDGAVRGSAAATYETRFPAPARAEQDPEAWWRAMGEAVPAALAAAGAHPREVAALACDTTSCTVVALDGEGRPLRPALLWMDVRAAAEAEAVRATGDPALDLNGAGRGPVSAEWMIPKALWLARHEPEIFDRAATICEYQDFLTMRLTGRRVASLNNVSMRWHWRNRQGGRPDSLLAALGLSALAEKWPADTVAPGAVIGGLTAAAAAHLGLPADLPVVQGGADAFIGMVGLGVARPGQVALITGSSHLQLAVTEREGGLPGLWGAYADVVYPGRGVVEGGQTSTGSIIAWLRRLMGEGTDLAALNRAAAALPPGAEGLLVLDHFQGNRTPHTDPLSRGGLVGLSLGHGPEHLFRAIVEGICFGTRAILDTMRGGGIETREIVVAGGATRSPLWLQIHADTAGIPLTLPRCADAPALGAGILAAVGAGHFASIDEGIAAMVAVDRQVEPDPGRARLYDELYARYAQLYPALAPFRAAPASDTAEDR